MYAAQSAFIYYFRGCKFISDKSKENIEQSKMSPS